MIASLLLCTSAVPLSLLPDMNTYVLCWSGVQEEEPRHIQTRSLQAGVLSQPNQPQQLKCERHGCLITGHTTAASDPWLLDTGIKWEMLIQKLPCCVVASLAGRSS